MIAFALLLACYAILLMCMNRPKPFMQHVTAAEPRHLVNLRVNRYPWIGSHDAATGGYVPLKYVPQTTTQSVNFDKQFELGANMFDLRVYRSGDDLHFHHGPIKLGQVSEDATFFNTLAKAVETKTPLLLFVSKFEANDQFTEFVEMVKSRVGNQHVFHMWSEEHVNAPLSTYTRLGQYILIVGEDRMQTNWDESITCQGDDCSTVEYLPGAGQCSKTCADNGERETVLFDHIAKVHASTEANRSKLQMIQCFWQAGTSACAQRRTIACGMNPLGHNLPVDVNVRFRTNDRLREFFAANPSIVPNVTLLNNINEFVPALKRQIVANALHKYNAHTH